MFTIIIPYYDTNSSFRQRNLFKVIKNYKSIAPDFEILIVEQNGNYQLEDILEDDYGCRYLNYQLPYDTFHKTRLLNNAIANIDNDYFIMADADCIVTKTAIESIKTEYNMGSILYPFNSVDYYNEAYTRKLVSNTLIEKSYKTDRGLPIKRFTGMVNCFSRDTYNRIGGFDEGIIGWGSEDDVFLMKCERIIGPSYRTNLDSPLIHMYHPKSDTEEYKKTNMFINNKKISALIKRMSDSDLRSYINDNSLLHSLLNKYNELGKLDLIINWKLRNVVITFDSTIYDVGTFESMSLKSILMTIYSVDGFNFMMSIVNELYTKVNNLSESDKNDINECIAMCS